MSLALRIADSDNSSEARWVLAELKAFVPRSRPLAILLLSIFPLIPAFFNFCIADDCRSPNLQFRICAQRALPLFSFVRDNFDARRSSHGSSESSCPKFSETHVEIVSIFKIVGARPL